MALAFASFLARPSHPTFLRAPSTTPLATPSSTFVPIRTSIYPRHKPLICRRSPSPCMTQNTSPTPNNSQTAKQLAQLYGGSYLGTSIFLSIISYIILYVMIAAGVDVRALVNAFGDLLSQTPIGRPAVLDSVSDTASTATLAYIAHKAVSPLRFPLTVAATPAVAKVFSKRGEDKEEKDS